MCSIYEYIRIDNGTILYSRTSIYVMYTYNGVYPAYVN